MTDTQETICLCKHVAKETIEKAIEQGADTIDKLGRATGAARGACKGARCKQKLNEMIFEKQAPKK